MIGSKQPKTAEDTVVTMVLEGLAGHKGLFHPEGLWDSLIPESEFICTFASNKADSWGRGCWGCTELENLG